MPPTRTDRRHSFPVCAMLTSLQPVFERYAQLSAEADSLFERVRAAHPDCVTCAPGCSDCCHAVFDLSLVEALLINRNFTERFGFGPQRSAVLAAAGKADRKAVRVKRDLYKSSRDGDTDGVMREAARTRIRCPLLGADEQCLLYDRRPITCRLYGVPAAVGGEAHVCGKTGFVKGRPYPTVALDKIQDRLADMSLEVARTLGSRFKELHLVYVPVSMALLTNYDAAYLGIGPAKPEKPA